MHSLTLVRRPAAAGLLALFAVAASACSDGVTGPDRDLAITTAGPVRFYAGDPSTVSITVTNNSRSRTYRIASSVCEDPFTVATAAGTALPARTRPCIAIALAATVLRPGRALVLSRDWAGDVGSGETGTLLAPGTYVVRGFVRVDDGATAASNAPLTTQILAR